MCKYRLNQQLIVLKLDSDLINKVLVTKFVTVKSFIESKFDAKFINAVKSTTYMGEVSKVIECLEQSF